MLKIISLLAVAMLLAFVGCTKTETETVYKHDTTTVTDSVWIDGMKVIKDADVEAGDSLVLDSDTTYLLDGFVFVESGASITIEAGTVVKANPGGGLDASALIICNGARIHAIGTASNPIIFTSRGDDLDYTDDLGLGARALWGGLILLGDASCTHDGGQIEGIPSTDTRGAYGGSDDDDNSGTLKYVSIRHGGSNIGEGNEINGLTMGGVGNGTTIDYVEVYNNSDDGFEWFGGTVNAKHLVSTGNADDSYDLDEGYRGKGQFWVAVQASNAGDRAGEWDGCDGDNRGDTQGFSKPTLYNATFIGTGTGSEVVGNMAFKLREEIGGLIHNSIFSEFYGDLHYDSNNAVDYVGVINIDNEKGSIGNLTSDHFVDGELVITHNIFGPASFNADSAHEQMKYSAFADTLDYDAHKDTITARMQADNYWVDPKLTMVTRGLDEDGEDPAFRGVIDLRPKSNSPALSETPKAEPSGDSFFDDVNYIGAFNASNDWMSGWTFTSEAY